MEASSHPQRVYSPGDVVPDDRQRKQRAPQFGGDAILEDMLVGVVVWQRNTGNDEASWNNVSTASCSCINLSA